MSRRFIDCPLPGYKAASPRLSNALLIGKDREEPRKLFPVPGGTENPVSLARERRSLVDADNVVGAAVTARLLPACGQERHDVWKVFTNSVNDGYSGL